MVLDQRRDLQEVPAEELGDGAAEGVVVVAGDHVSGAGYVDGLGVGNQLLELVDGGLGGVIVNTCGLVFFRRPPFRSGWPGCRPVRVG